MNDQRIIPKRLRVPAQDQRMTDYHLMHICPLFTQRFVFVQFYTLFIFTSIILLQRWWRHSFNSVCMYNIFIIIIRANCMFFFCADCINLLLLLFHFESIFSLSLRMYVSWRVLDVFRRVFHYDCVLLMLYFCCFDRLFSDWLMCGFCFYISVFYSYITLILIFLLYNCCFFCHYFVIFLCKPALYSVDCTNW